MVIVVGLTMTGESKAMIAGALTTLREVTSQGEEILSTMGMTTTGRALIRGMAMIAVALVILREVLSLREEILIVVGLTTTGEAIGRTVITCRRGRMAGSRGGGNKARGVAQKSGLETLEYPP